MSDRRRPPVVVFVDAENAGRSQMAEMLFNRRAEGRALARSAGTTPGDAVYPVVIEAMAEVGIDLSAARPKPLADVLDGTGWVVIMEEVDDPVAEGVRRLEWEVADPANASLNGVRGIRNDIRRLVDLLLADVVG